MADPNTLNSKLYALLIGVDYYLPNRLPDGGSYPSLGGCVRDINHVERFLKDRLGLPGEQIIKLTATNTGTDKPAEPKDVWPTYKNMVAAFQKITEMAQPGEQVYVHYSGHGGRSVTSFPKLKGKNGLDESLVPTDIGNSEARYLRDIELAHLLKRMSDKGLIVTVIFDSCHSGGATRGGGTPGVGVRGISSIDTTPRPTESLVASEAELEQTWQGVAPEATRSAQLGAGWLPPVKNSILLAACRADELANEFPFDGNESNGALTYWLLDSLKQIGPELTFDMLHDRILAKVHAKFRQQTPQLHGEGSRVVFDTAHVPRPPSARVLNVDRSSQRLRVEIGQAQGIGVGARFAIYSAATKDFDQEGARLAIAEATEVEATESWAGIIEGGNVAGIEEGAQAVLLDAGNIRFRGRIRLAHRDDLPAEIDQAGALQRLGQEIKERKWIKVAEGDEGADYQVAVSLDGEYEVWEPSGELISNLRPALKITDQDAARTMADRLVHLTKYSNIKLIDNSSSTSPLARQIELTVAEEKVKGPGGDIVLDEGERLTFVIRNTSTQPLNITVLDMQPDWGVTKLYPPDSDSELLDPKSTLEVPLEFELPPTYKEGRETIKVFATVGNTSFDWLQLPALDQPPPATRATRSAGNPLEKLMADFAADAPPTSLKRASLVSVALAKWTTAQADVTVRRRPPTIKHVRDVSRSLLQSAFEQVAEDERRKTRGAGGDGTRGAGATRASVSEPLSNAITAYFADPTELPDALSRPREGEATRGAWDTVKYCADMAAGMASEFWNAHVRGNREAYEAYQAALFAPMGDCDPRFGQAVQQYVQFLLKKGKVPYRKWQQISDFVFDGKLPRDAVIGLVADWGTGQAEALEVLRQVKGHNPQVVVHLGDIYYAGTASEVENYFYRPWQEILQPEANGITSLVLPGNHDLYAGGQPFYDLVDKFSQGASYFCLRNDDWQLIGLDTALHDQLGGPPTSLEPSELEWLRDKLENAGNRRTMLLSHHQLFSTNEQFGDEKKSYNPILHEQLAGLLSKVDIWLWGHEHDLVIFDEYMGLKRGRCIGGSAFPVGKYEVGATQKNPDVPFNKQVVLSKGAAFYQHCYAVMRLDGASATLDYYEDGDGGRRLFTETF